MPARPRRLPVLALLLLGAAAWVGQGAPASAQQKTTATYDDWVLRCDTRAGTPPRKVCEMEQVAEVQGKSAPVSRVAITREIAGHPLLLVVQVPVNVWLATGVKLDINKQDAGLAGAFDRCIPAGCFANIDLKTPQVKQFGTTVQPGKIVYKDGAGRDVAIPLSFKGFAAAFEALMKS